MRVSFVNFQTGSFEVGSEGTTPHLVWVEHLQLVSQSIVEIQVLLDFEIFCSRYPFHIFHRSLDPSLSPKKCQNLFFGEDLSFLPHVLSTVGAVHSVTLH